MQMNLTQLKTEYLECVNNGCTKSPFLNNYGFTNSEANTIGELIKKITNKNYRDSSNHKRVRSDKHVDMYINMAEVMIERIKDRQKGVILSSKKNKDCLICQYHSLIDTEYYGNSTLAFCNTYSKYSMDVPNCSRHLNYGSEEY